MLRGILVVLTSFSELWRQGLSHVSPFAAVMFYWWVLYPNQNWWCPRCAALCAGYLHFTRGHRCAGSQPSHFIHFPIVVVVAAAVVVVLVVVASYGKWRKFIQNFCIRLNFKTMFMQQATKAAGKCNIRNERGAVHLCGTYRPTLTHSHVHSHASGFTVEVSVALKSQSHFRGYEVT